MDNYKFCLRYKDVAFDGNFSHDQMESWRYIQVKEDTDDANVHWHGYLETPTKISRTRELIKSLLTQGGNGAYSIKNFQDQNVTLTFDIKLDPYEIPDYFRYMFKLNKKYELFNEFVEYLTPRYRGNMIMWTHSQCYDAHKKYWEVHESLKDDKKSKQKPPFARYLVETFEKNNLKIYQSKYLETHPIGRVRYLGWCNKWGHDPECRSATSQYREKRLKYLSNFVLMELDAETKCFDQFIVQRFVLLLENRFNPDGFRDSFSRAISEKICDFIPRSKWVS